MMTTAYSCGCRFRDSTTNLLGDWHKCPLHAAAEELLAACKVALPALATAATELQSGYLAKAEDTVRGVISKAGAKPGVEEEAEV